jgi:hypothetical protein
MRVTIIADDSKVVVEGQLEIVDLSTLDEEIHAVQWYGTVGEVEYKHDYIENTRKPNDRITDFSPYQKFVDAWEVEAKKPLLVTAPVTVPVTVPGTVPVANAAQVTHAA